RQPRRAGGRGLPLHARERQPGRGDPPRRAGCVRRSAAPQAGTGCLGQPENSLKKLVFLVLLGGCASAAPPKPTEPDPKQDAHLFYPLAAGNSWTYAESRTGKRETIQIIGQDGPWFLDDHGGRLRYEPDGVRDADRYLLRTPITAGAKWSAV